MVRNEVLRMIPWNFAQVRVTVTRDSAAPDHEYDSRYQLPTNCLRVVEVDSEYPWVVEGRMILIDGTDPLPFRYTAEIVDTSQYDPLFVSAAASRLAMDVCERLTQSNSKLEAISKIYEYVIKKARSADGQEQSPKELEEDSWVTARL
jgi:hypothetical protein